MWPIPLSDEIIHVGTGSNARCINSNKGRKMYVCGN
jgi:hypothetical protein